MSFKRSYEPCFLTAADTVLDRWELLREFARRWHGVSLEAVGEKGNLDNDEQVGSGKSLPLSFKEYIAFAGELIAQDKFGILRDEFDHTYLDAHLATSLMVQSGGDVYWAVEDKNLKYADPPVSSYFLDYENERSFIFGGVQWSTITSFVLGHMAHYLHGNGGGCLVSIKVCDHVLNELRVAFTNEMVIGNIRIFEKRNIIVFLIPDDFRPDNHILIVELFCSIPISEVPHCVLSYANNGGSFHGIFADRKPPE